MSQTTAAQFLIDTRGTQRSLDAFVVSARFSLDSRSVAFALGDGTLRIVRLGDPEAWDSVAVHNGAALALSADTAGGGFVSGGDDGQLRRIDAAGTVTDIAKFGMKWVEQVAVFAAETGKGLIAASVGKLVHLYDESGQKIKEWTHPSAVTGRSPCTQGASRQRASQKQSHHNKTHKTQ